MITCFLEWQGVTPLAILFSAITAVVAIWYARKNARQQKTVEFLFSLQQMPDFWDSLATLRALHAKVTPEELQQIGMLIGEPRGIENEKCEERLSNVKTFRYILNVFENISIGISHGIYDEKIVKEMFVSSFISTWTYAKPVAMKVREVRKKESYYEAYEKIAEKWANNDG